MEAYLDKNKFYAEVEKYINNYINIHNKDLDKIEIDYGFLERAIFDHQEDIEVRKFIVRGIKQALQLINELVEESKRHDEYKNLQIINFLYYYNTSVKDYYAELVNILDYTGYRGDFKYIRIMFDLMNKLIYKYNEDIDYSGEEIRTLIDFIRCIGNNNRTNMLSEPPVKPYLHEEIRNYLIATSSNKYQEDERFISIYADYYYGQKAKYDINDETFIEYIKLLIGNIGERLILNELQRSFEVMYCAKEIGDYVGYDIYYIDESENREKLIEVKATKYYTYDGKEDDFNIGKTELPKLRATLNEPNADYIIKRVFITFDSNGIKEYKTVNITVKDENTLIDEDGNIYTIYTDKKGKPHFKCDNITRKNKLVRN